MNTWKKCPARVARVDWPPAWISRNSKLEWKLSCVKNSRIIGIFYSWLDRSKNLASVWGWGWPWLEGGWGWAGSWGRVHWLHGPPKTRGVLLLFGVGLGGWGGGGDWRRGWIDLHSWTTWHDAKLSIESNTLATLAILLHFTVKRYVNIPPLLQADRRVPWLVQEFLREKPSRFLPHRLFLENRVFYVSYCDPSVFMGIVSKQRQSLPNSWPRRRPPPRRRGTCGRNWFWTLNEYE